MLRVLSLAWPARDQRYAENERRPTDMMHATLTGMIPTRAGFVGVLTGRLG